MDYSPGQTGNNQEEEVLVTFLLFHALQMGIGMLLI